MSIRIIKEVDELSKGARVFIYGAGAAGKGFFFYLCKMRPDIKILGFIDTYKKGKCCGYKVYRFNEFFKAFKKNDYDLILIASMFHDEISELLMRNGIDNFLLVKWKNPTFNFFVESKDLCYFLKRITSFLIKIIAWLFPKNKNKFLIVGEYGGNFVGNSKYFYLYLKRNKNLEVYWLTGKKSYYERFKKFDIKALNYKKIKTFFHILNTKYVVLDNRDWRKSYLILDHSKAKKIQLWHGVGFKSIGFLLIDKDFLKRLTKEEFQALKKRNPSYDLLITTSDFYSEKVFAPAFGMPIEKVKPLGYPRNDIFYRDIPGEEINTDEKVLKFAKAFKKSGGKIIVFAPTFRDLNIKVDMRSIFNYEKLNSFLLAHNIIFIIKGHPLPYIKYEIEKAVDLYKNILIYDNSKDVYPLLKITDLLITDYSSIYTDFLHTGRPVLFYPFDYEEYTDLHRQLQFDYNEMTPGPKAKNFGELLNWINHFLVEGKDGFESERERILNLAFKYKDGNSSQRIFEEIMELR